MKVPGQGFEPLPPLAQGVAGNLELSDPSVTQRTYLNVLGSVYKVRTLPQVTRHNELGSFSTCPGRQEIEGHARG